MCVASWNGMQQYIQPILKSRSSSLILEFEQGDISPWFMWR